MPNPAKLARAIEKGKTLFRAVRKEAIPEYLPKKEYYSPLEPKGLYFSEDAVNLAPLIDPNTVNNFPITTAKESIRSIANNVMHTIREGKPKNVPARKLVKVYKARVQKGKKPRILDLREEDAFQYEIDQLSRKHPELSRTIYESYESGFPSSSTGLLHAKDTTDALTKQFRKKADIVILPDRAAGQKYLNQVVVLNPGFMQGRLGRKSWKFGVAGALSASAMSQGDEAQAMGKIEMLKLGGKAAEAAAKRFARGAKSSSTEVLRGVTFKGKKILNVLKTDSPHRRLVQYADGSTYDMGKKELTDIVRAVQRNRYGAKQQAHIDAGDEQSSIAHALRSMKMHMERYRQYPQRERQNIMAFTSRHRKRVRDLGIEDVEMVYVQKGEMVFPMDKRNAEILQGIGQLRITGKVK